MTEEANKIVEALRDGGEYQCCSYCESGHLPDCGDRSSCVLRNAADLIECLSTDLAEAEEVNDALSIMLTAAQSATETFRREHDALLADLKEAAKMDCSTCKYYEPDDGRCEKADFVCRDCSLGLKDCPCRTCEGACNWNWRGVVKTDNEAGD